MLGALRGTDGAIHVIGNAERRIRDLAAGGRIDHSEGSARARGRELTVDEIVPAQGSGQVFGV
ncbi:hypothetical protein D3C72_1127120 [compost metagenome]